MEVRYLGFAQRQNERSYEFLIMEKGDPSGHFTVTADLPLFHTYGVPIQDGPSLCAAKLMADLESESTGAHELTADDLLSFIHARTEAEAKRAATHKTPRRHTAPAEGRTPWSRRGV